MSRFTNPAGGDGSGTPGPTGAQGVQGSQGVQGLQGTTGAGTQGLQGSVGADALWNYVGEYNGGASYAVGDVVTYDGQLWYRFNANGGNVGDTPSPGLWNLLAAKGTDGAQGATGSDFGIYYLGNYVSTSGYIIDIAVVRGSDGQLYLAKASGQLGDPIDYQTNGQWEVWIPKGTDGAQGSTGTQGIQGETGTQGIQGEQGLTGSDGVQGIIGAQGSTGIQGDTGAQGAQGSTGTQGAEGLQGAGGYVGSDGAQGTQGITGSNGNDGAQGAQGVQGTQGEVGIQGVEGQIGIGLEGAQGIQGTTGNTGAGGVIANHGAFYSNVQQSIAVVGTPQAITFNNSYPTPNGISIIDGSKIVMEHVGTYEFTFIAQVANIAQTSATASFWIKYMGQDWPSSGKHVDLLQRKTSSIASDQLVTVSLIGTSVNPNDYIELYWEGSDTGLSVHTTSINAVPESPSVMATIHQITYQGIQGETGTQGIQGEQGLTGSDGVQGIIGAQGSTGIQGDTGAQGAQGSTGTQGADGVGNYQGTYAYYRGYNIGDVVVSDGIPYVNTTGVNGNAYPVTQDATNWITLAGATGTQGANGVGNYQGTYAYYRGYSIGDVVVWDSIPYVNTTGVNGNAFPVTYDPVNWITLAGAQGTTGTTGTQGTTGAGVIAAGTAGQVLSKIDGTNYNTQWSNPRGLADLTDATSSSTATSLGYLGMPQLSKATSYTLAVGDAGKHVYITATSTITIPAATTVPFPIGTTIGFVSGVGATTTIAITSDTMYLAGTGTTGSRTLAAWGMATAVKVAATTWYISGNGLT